MKFEIENRIIIAGHRGNPKYVPENTIESFKSAIDLKVDMIETDIRVTKDGVLVLIHDEDLSRTAGNDGVVGDMTFEELRKINVGTENQSMKVPTLRELLELAAPVEGLLLDLEIKIYSDKFGVDMVHYTVDKTVELCKEFNMLNRVMFNSFDAYVLEYIHKKYPNEYILHGYYPYNIMRNVNENPKNYLDYACYWGNGKESCEFLISNGIMPCTGSKTGKDEFYLEAANGCRMFTENDPASALEWKKSI